MNATELTSAMPPAAAVSLRSEPGSDQNGPFCILIPIQIIVWAAIANRWAVYKGISKKPQT